MGCCASFSQNQVEENNEDELNLKNSQHISFLDLSIESAYEIEKPGQSTNTEELNLTQTSRFRSTSCNSFHHITQLETAFLLGTPYVNDKFLCTYRRSSPCCQNFNEN